MGIKQRVIGGMTGMFLCWLCSGCGRGQSLPMEQAQTFTPKETVSIVIQDTVVPAETPKPESAKPTEKAAETPTPELPKPTETPTETPTPEPPKPTETPTETPTPEPAKPTEKAAETPTPEPPKPTETPTETPTPEPAKPTEKAAETPTPEPPKPTEKAVETPTPEPPKFTEAPHVHTVTVELQAATCLKDGWRKEYCIGCGEILGETTEAAKGHDFVKSVWETPTCTKGGYYNNVCSRCGQVECVTEKPLPHEVEDILIQEGNCMNDTVIWHVCKVCGIQAREETRYTPHDKHSLVTGQVDGREITYCERCGVAQ